MPARAKEPTSEPILERVSPDDLLFDPENPRFAGSFAGCNQEEIQKAIYDSPYFASELVDSFLENGFIDYEPLVVRRKHKKFVVVEGNRRLAAIKEIRANRDKYEDVSSRIDDLDEIPVLVFPETLNEQTRKEIRVYLGVRHLLGIRDWPPFSKAKYLEKETSGPDGLKKVMQETRLSKAQIRRFLVPFRMLAKADVDLPPEEDFWMLGEAVSRTGVQKYLQLEVNPKTLEVLSVDKKNLRTLLDDIYGPAVKGRKGRDASHRLVSDTRELSRYATVLESDAATKALRSGKSLSEALILVDTRVQSSRRLMRLLSETHLILNKLTSGVKSPLAKAMLEDFKRFASSAKRFDKSHG